MVTGIKLSAAAFMMMRPVDVSPVKAIFAMRLDSDKGLPASNPVPVTTFNTPTAWTSADDDDDDYCRL